jgi:hypothetical protein
MEIHPEIRSSTSREPYGLPILLQSQHAAHHPETFLAVGPLPLFEHSGPRQQKPGVVKVPAGACENFQEIAAK